MRKADGDHHLSGTVADVAFRGRGYEHAIDAFGHGRLTGIFAPVRAERGETVGLQLDPAGCHVFPAAAEPATGQPAAAADASATKVPAFVAESRADLPPVQDSGRGCVLRSHAGNR